MSGGRKSSRSRSGKSKDIARTADGAPSHALLRTLGNQGLQRLLRASVGQRPRSLGGETTEAPPLVHEVLRSPGQSLDPATRDFMEPRLGADFRDVRVHSDAEAAASAQLMGAQAYTVGQDVVFAAGKFSPATAHGRALLAHELTHVRQDPRARERSTSGVVIGSRHDPAEAEAAATAAGALRGESVRPGPRAAAVGGPAILRRAEATGGTADSDRDAQIDADVQRIIAILDEWHYSKADEQQVIDILTKWALAPPGPGRLTPLDRVFTKLTRRTTTVGVMGQTMSYYSLIFNHFDRAQEVRELRDRHAPLFHGEAGIQEASLLEQDWMRTAGEFYGPIKEGFYEALIAGMRGTQAAALNRMRAMIANWPPAAKAVGEVAIAYVELNMDILISLVLAIVGLVVGFVSGIVKMVWGLLQFLWGIVDLVMLWILSHFSEARAEQLQERAEAIDEGIRQFFPALNALAHRWWAEFQTASPDRQSLMIGELTGEIEAILASFLAGGKVAAAPKLQAVPARALAVVGGGTLVRGGAITAGVAAAGPPLIAGTLVGTTAMAVSEEAKSGGPPEPAPKEPPGSAKPKEPAPKEPAPKKPLPSERKFQPGEWEKLTPKEQQDFVKQWMEEHGVKTLYEWNEHHAWPKYLGGPEAGPLETLDERLHQLFHAGLDQVLPRKAGQAFYASLSELQKIENIKTLLRYTRDFDVTYGTKVYPRLVKALQGGPYEALPGTL